MTKYLLTTSVAALALGLATPSYAQKATPGGDDNATIVQSYGSGNVATQHQPGLYGNSAYINQYNDTSSVATQEQWRNLNGNDFAVGGQQKIYQTTNYKSTAAQVDNSYNAKQTATQTSNGVSGTTVTSVKQTINSPFGHQNVQNSTQTSDYGSSVQQRIGSAAPGDANQLDKNTQTANQSGQTLSSIDQLIDGDSHGNTQNASETGSGQHNSISQTILASYKNTQTASIAGVSSNNAIKQLQQAGSHDETQWASITNGSYNYVDQLQATNSHNNSQQVTVNGSNSGRALQFQGANVNGGSQSISQTNGGYLNQAGQAQGNDSNVASITQSGGIHNIALQNQGILPGQTGFMVNVGGFVQRTP